MTRLKSEKFGVQPTELPLPTRKRERKSPKGSDSEALSPSSSISTSSPRSQPSTPPLQIIVHQPIGTSTYPSQSSGVIISSSSRPQGSSSPLPFVSKSVMAQSPWNNPGVVLMPAPLSQLPTHPEKWLPKFNPEEGMLAEEYINNFMLSINLNGVTNEDVFICLFPYTLQGTARSWYFSLPYGSITSWDIFEEKFLIKFGDDRSTATLISDLSNLRAQSKEPIKDFNSRFNKLLNKIPTASKLSEEERSEWYITALPSNIAIFVDRANKTTLDENMKEAIAIEKQIIALEKKTAIEERKSKKVTFKEDPKKKQSKDPFDLEGLQNFLKTMSNEMVDIKKQVVETSSKKPYRDFKRNPSTNSKPPNAITNAKSEEEEEIATEEQTDEEEVVELQGMWDFILPQEENQETFPVSTRRRNQLDPPQTTPKPKSASSATKDKVAPKKTTSKATQTNPVKTDASTPSKTLIVSDEMEYNIVEDMKKN